MARNQKNFKYFSYVDDNAVTWNVKGEDNGAFTAVDGHATFSGTAPVWIRASRRAHPRYVVAQDPTTFRIVKGIIYTPAAYAAITPGQAISVGVAGLVGPVTYNVIQKIAEKRPLAHASRNLADF